ncbi:hypothetical protein F1Z66_13775 [Candidatus Nitrosocosmicus sp. SS]|jgi:transposase-like protein|nr:hypothetical protein F1Z66_13775 [Candidatus Nitrosocosmicus sp. SS]
MLKVGLEYICLWIAIEPKKNKQILALTISKERNMFVAEHFLAGIVREYGKHVSSFYRWWYMVSNGL